MDDLPVWSLSCLYVRKGWRRQGVTSALIAAAPDLLNACKAVMAWVEDSKYRDAVDILRAAIAKVDILRAAIAKAEHGT